MPENVHLPACVKKKNIRKDDANFETICNEVQDGRCDFPQPGNYVFFNACRVERRENCAMRHNRHSATRWGIPELWALVELSALCQQRCWRG
jgi:hypothetical protein